ncbi:MAG: GGDEF domain-containing protein [Bacillota bacterium]|nr:GGDEF domain-containing protein [Bacillota bacterium]
MKKFQILRYLNKAKYFIFAFALIGSILVYYYAISHQSYTAKAIIEYNSKDATKGLTPKGDKIDVSKVYSSRVITNAISELDTSTTMESIRSRTKVTPVIPEEETAKKEAALAGGKEYSYFPTKYMISFTAYGNGKAGFARDVLDSVIQNYFAYYSEEYVDTNVLPSSADEVSSKQYDYIESAELIEKNVSDIIEYLQAKDKNYPNFRSSMTGYGFGDLVDLYNNIYNNSVPELYATILEGKYSRNIPLLLKKYQNRISDNQLSINSLDDKMAKLESLMGEYSGKTGESIKYNYQQNTENFILKDVYGGETKPHQNTTYDDLLKDYVSLDYNRRLAQIDNDYVNYILGIYGSSGNVVAETASEEQITQKISALSSQLKGLHKILEKTIEEYNSYQGAKNISCLTSINVSETLNVKLYIMLALIFFVFMGCIISAIFGRISDFIEYFIYTDRKTGLPNRARCDLLIERLSHEVLKDNFTIVCITLDNLELLSMEKGRGTGDMQLKAFGGILGETAENFGFIGYNGGKQFLGFFAECNEEQSELFAEALKDKVEYYNSSEDNQIFINYSLTFAETSKEHCYKIRDLIRRAIIKCSKEEHIVRQEEKDVSENEPENISKGEPENKTEVGETCSED